MKEKFISNICNSLMKNNNKLKELKSSRILITGATGFIGSIITEVLMFLNDVHGYNIKIIAFVRDIKKASMLFGTRNDISFVCGNIINASDVFSIDVNIDYVFHCAAVTKSASMIAGPVETADGIVIGTKNILELAKRKNVKSMVYVSSMEVYGRVKDTGKLITEDNLGDIDIFSLRSCYPLGKRMAENYCYSYYKEYGVPVKIARLAQTFGVGILPGENRIFAQFANAVRNNTDIVLHTAGNSMGNYCDSTEAVEALFILLLNGENGEAYNVVNESNTMKIREMAELVVEKLAGNKIKIIYDIPKENKYGYAPDTCLRLSSAKMQALGWKPKKGLEVMYKEMIAWMNYNDY